MKITTKEQKVETVSAVMRSLSLALEIGDSTNYSEAEKNKVRQFAMGNATVLIAALASDLGLIENTSDAKLETFILVEHSKKHVEENIDAGKILIAEMERITRSKPDERAETLYHRMFDIVESVMDNDNGPVKARS